MQLVSPSLKYAESWKAGLNEFKHENLRGFWNYFNEPTTAEKYITECQEHAKGVNLRTTQQPSQTYWLIDNNQFIGHCNIRHKLPKDNTYPGHIGYHIIKSKRGKGYGTKILEFAIKKAQKLGINQLILYTDDTNFASQKVIQKNGGKKTRTFTRNDDKLIEWVIDKHNLN